jgi:hypothetical protein
MHRLRHRDTLDDRSGTAKARTTYAGFSSVSVRSAGQDQILIDQDPPRTTRLPATLPPLPATNQSVSDNFLG